MSAPTAQPIRLHYAWIVAALTFVTLLAAAGVRATPGVLMVPLEHEFGWTRGTISLAIAINIFLYGLMGPFSAAFVDRLGLRRTISLSLSLVAIGVAATNWMTESWQLILLWGVVVGAGTGMTAMALGAAVVNRWFAERRGVVMGALSASTATGQLVFLPLLASLVEAYGWRAAALTTAGAAALVVPLAALFMRNRPSDLGLTPYGAAPDAVEPPRPTTNPLLLPLLVLREVSGRRDFWLLFASFFVCGASTNGLIGTHMISACIDNGIPEVRGASLLAVMGIFDLIGTTLSGWLSDRWNNRYLLFWYYGLRGLSLIYLPFAFDLSFYGLSVFAVFYGLDWIATVPPTVRLTADCFGREKAGIVFGWILTGHQIGAACAALTAGLMRSALGSYLEAFILSGSLCLGAALLVLAIGRNRDRDRGSVPAAQPA